MIEHDDRFWIIHVVRLHRSVRMKRIVIVERDADSLVRCGLHECLSRAARRRQRLLRDCCAGEPAGEHSNGYENSAIFTPGNQRRPMASMKLYLPWQDPADACGYSCGSHIVNHQLEDV